MRWNTKYSEILEDVPQFGPLNAYLAGYNDSELIAWRSGATLKTFVESEVPSDYRRNVVAHSMGNIVVGSALMSGLKVSNYVMLQSAVPACCIDDSETLKQNESSRDYGGVNISLWEGPFPDEDTGPKTRSLAYRGRLSEAMKNVLGTLSNFYLEGDYATVKAWELNNDLKPDLRPETGDAYWYLPGEDDGQKLYQKVGNNQRYLTDPFEAMAFACRAWSKTVGADGRTGGAIKRKVDLGKAPYDFKTEHSAAFERTIQRLVPFYDLLLESLGHQP